MPNPPPTSGTRTRTRSIGTFKMASANVCCRPAGFWQLVCRVMRPLVLSNSAMLPRGSMVTGMSRWLWSESLVMCLAFANAAAQASGLPHCICAATLPGASRPDLWRALRERAFDRRYRGKLLVLHGHLLDGVLGLCARLGDDCGDGLADETDVVDRKRVVRGRALRFSFGVCQARPKRERADTVFGQLSAGQDRDNTGGCLGGRGVDRNDACVRMRRTHEGQMRFVGQRQIVDVLARASDEPLVFASRQRLADTELGHCIDPV